VTARIPAAGVRCSILKPAVRKWARREWCTRPAEWSVAQYPGGPRDETPCSQHLAEACRKVAAQQSKPARADGVSVLPFAQPTPTAKEAQS